jgi:riboflavin kinase
MERIEAGSLRGNLLLTLCRVAELSSSHGELSYTTGQLSAKLGKSQQTASRHLIELERVGLIRRVRIAKRESIYVTSKGLNLLNEIYLTLKNVFELPVGEIYLEGELFSGLGEGAYYINQEGYRKQFREKLGFDPYPGTLNIKLKAGYENEKSAIESLTLIQIEGFKTENRRFGQVKCAKAIIEESLWT